MIASRRVLSLSTLYPNALSPRFGTFVARSLEALAARGDWDVTVVNPIGIPPIAFGPYRALRDAALDGVEGGVQVYRPRFTLIPRVGGRFNPGAIVRAALPLVRRLHAEKPFDVIDAQFFYPDGPAIARIAAALNVPYSIKARGADISFWGRKPYALRMMREAADGATGLLAVSRALADDMATIGLPSDRMSLHYTGLDRTLFHPRNRAETRRHLASLHGTALPASGRLLATVGALIPRKGQAYVIRALPDLPDAHLLLVGKGQDESLLRDLAKELGVAERVHFLGSLDHTALPLVLAACDAMVLPSASEGLANAWVEALACGTPLVITEAGGARELVKDDSAGLIVPRDSRAIAAAVRDLLSSPRDPAVVAAHAAPFSWENNAAALAAWYESLAGAH
ncbi:putative glycosyltransferase [Caenibius tardaugens NBRC 16725]|uniref:Putative glycosyltransferase n=1 Tax=Caenibius tardaugens NBRC 16725 TaxID=1219035 RepID=U2ZYL3_9SPHN|nr:glycosyltransferase [Caenibius tardaugens]AZI37142.1 glycosyltransferase family 4 protein [Caenibius tardaugens NBRC 16725]GAD47618.1 putative glycosyltransferase [Caenibius tardaugens NBRC 16725]